MLHACISQSPPRGVARSPLKLKTAAARQREKPRSELLLFQMLTGVKKPDVAFALRSHGQKPSVRRGLPNHLVAFT